MSLVWFLSILLHGYVALRIVSALVGWPAAAAALHRAGMTALGANSSLVVLTLLRDAGLLLAHAADALWPAAVDVAVVAAMNGLDVATPLSGGEWVEVPVRVPYR